MVAMPVAKRPVVRKRPAQPEHAGSEPVPATRQERDALICRLAAEGQKKKGRGFLSYVQERLPEPVSISVISRVVSAMGRAAEAKKTPRVLDPQFLAPEKVRGGLFLVRGVPAAPDDAPEAWLLQARGGCAESGGHGGLPAVSGCRLVRDREGCHDPL